MELIIEESNMNTIAALSMTAMKSDNKINAINKHVQTEYVKGSMDATVIDYQHSPSAVRAAFHNMPVCDPIEISFKDVSYSVQKMFSKSKSRHIHNL
jgi:2-phospho-L-lactate transferase/gluconeogenesis factor (CofD/UPF0052 family)